jgi:hypothetical protein
MEKRNTFEEIKDRYNLKLTNETFNSIINEINSKNNFSKIVMITKCEFENFQIDDNQIFYIHDFKYMLKFNHFVLSQKKYPVEIWYNEGIKINKNIGNNELLRFFLPKIFLFNENVIIRGFWGISHFQNEMKKYCIKKNVLKNFVYKKLRFGYDEINNFASINI